MYTSRFLLAMVVAIACIAFFSCEKNATDQTTLHIHLTDGPGDFQQVNVDIQEIRIKSAQDSAQWISLPTNAGIYNLLDFQNGIDTLIASGPVPLDTLKEVRFILGPNNSVMVDSVLYALETPSAQQSGLKIKINKHLNLDVNTLLLDFDAAESIKIQGNGVYRLHPVIKLK
ncbi:MAG: DUF4382 domain-containing protein [Chitinophagales bacterium]|nr:DUF4382 domain-containing protein [Chitinophagales bacterium]